MDAYIMDYLDEIKRSGTLDRDEDLFDQLDGILRNEYGIQLCGSELLNAVNYIERRF